MIDIQGLDEQEVKALHAALSTGGGGVITKWLVDWEDQSLSAMVSETDINEICRYQGQVKTVRSLLGLFKAVRDAVHNLETQDG